MRLVDLELIDQESIFRREIPTNLTLDVVKDNMKDNAVDDNDDTILINLL